MNGNVFRSLFHQFGKQPRSRIAVVRFQSALELIQLIVKGSVEQFHSFQQRGAAFGHQNHRVRSMGAILFQKRFGNGLAGIALIGVAQDERLAHRIVTDYRLKVSVRCIHGSQGKWHAPVNQRDRALPR